MFVWTVVAFMVAASNPPRSLRLKQAPHRVTDNHLFVGAVQKARTGHGLATEPPGR
jgi:hypothetical protein